MDAPRGPLAELADAVTEVPLVDGTSTRFVNFDYAASAPPLASVHRVVTTTLAHYASIHRGQSYLSRVSTAAYERARDVVAASTGARSDDVVIFTRNTTDALNLLASATPGRVVHFDIEHHANLLPWRAGAWTAVPAADTVDASLAALERELTREPAALVAVTGASNVTGECLPLDTLAQIAHRHGARLAVDGAQLVPHRPVDLGTAGIDYLACSGHKLYAPYGVGALIGRRDWLDAAEPHQHGGGAVLNVTLDDVQWKPSPARHEGGTPNLVGAVGNCISNCSRACDGSASPRCGSGPITRMWSGSRASTSPDTALTSSPPTSPPNMGSACAAASSARIRCFSALGWVTAARYA
jgi:selenocysteine lyase/cysteine desulfurase